MKNLIIILAIALTACSTSSRNENSVNASRGIEKLDVATFQSKVKESSNAVVLDVRTAEEFKTGNIEGAINIDFKASDFEQKIANLDKSKTYFVYCLSGIRSAKAADRMSELGFTSLYTLDGGYRALTENQ
ncbi:MAG TPA: rhodanese-like domain-containing protein [Chryseolinea sp.]|nr:rhodanese-like domain-containing protein [Flavobacteriales bacterium]HPM32516.1 rhodanese-like domain-containing protein [Chryseolinea sp.]